jgi:protein-disulfide isomerase/uncharacterized membrane protein
MSSRRAMIVILLALGGGVLSGLLLLEHHGETLGVSAVAAVCGEGASSGCETVARSAYSSVGGVPLAAVGLAFYLALGVFVGLSLLGADATRASAGRASGYAVAAALVLDLVLLGIQAFAIKAFCRLCLGTYVVNALALATLWPLVRSRASALSALLTGEGRFILAGWAATSLALVAAILASNSTLSYREARRTSGLLGAPMTAAPGDPLQQARAETRRLQEILDDPQKREQYLTEKAVKDFENAPPQSFDLARTPFSGPENAPIRVVEFSDYLCPYCRALAAAFKEYLPRSGDRVAIFYKNYPLDKTCNTHLQSTVHEGACWLAMGAICAQQLGHFPAYQEKIYTTPAKPMTRQDAIGFATDVGIPGPAMGACLDAPATTARLNADIDEGVRVGVRATPTVFLNGKMLPRVNDFLLAVDKESRRLGLPPMPTAPPSR